MADFREELRIVKHTSGIGIYMYTWAKFDLAQSGDEPIEAKHGVNLSLGEACGIIDDFVSGDLLTRKAYILSFMVHDKFFHSEEY